MAFKAVLKKGESAIMWIYAQILNKFKRIYNKLLNWFPVFKQYPSLKYVLIPMVFALFFLLRYVLKSLLGVLTNWFSVFLGETSGYAVSENSVLISIIVVFIVIRIVFMLRGRKKENHAKNNVQGR